MGTHPIFESDFDCLTENKMRITQALRVASNKSLAQRMSSFVPSMEYYKSDYDKIVGTKDANPNNNFHTRQYWINSTNAYWMVPGWLILVGWVGAKWRAAHGH